MKKSFHREQASQHNNKIHPLQVLDSYAYSVKLKNKL